MQTTECPICQRQKNSQPIFETQEWVVRHAAETNIVGYVLLEAKRHYLDLSEATAAEAASYGQILQKLTVCIRKIIQPPRIYTVALGEVVPHFHTHVIPRTNHIPRAYRGRGILSYPLEPKADTALVQSFSERLGRALVKH